MRKSRFVCLIAPVFLILLSVGSADAEEEGSEPSSTSIYFPPANLQRFENHTPFAEFLTSAFGMDPVDGNRTVVNPTVSWMCCLRDWQNRTVPIANETSVLVWTGSGQSIWMEFSGNGSLAFVRVTGLFGEELPSTDLPVLTGRVDEIAQNLGITGQPRNWTFRTGTSSVLANGSRVTVPSVTAITYGSYGGESVAFGNELRVTFSQLHLRAVQLEVFPWFTADSPSLVGTEALSIASDYLNASAARHGGTLKVGSVYYAFDSIHYSPVFQVEASWDGLDPAIRGYRVWVNPFTGSVDYFAELYAHGTGSVPPSLLPWPILVGFAMLLLIGLVAGLARMSERFCVAVFLSFGMVLSRIRRDHALDHFVRGQIYAFVVLNPGATFSEIRDAFSLNNGTASYHLSVLESIGFVRSQSEGRHKRFLSQESGTAGLGRRLSTVQIRIMDVVRQRGSASPSEVALAVGISRQRASYNLRKLATQRLVALDTVRKGRYVASPEPTPALPE